MQVRLLFGRFSVIELKVWTSSSNSPVGLTLPYPVSFLGIIDFDGDELNCHFPQSDLARAEAQYIARTDLQYIVPTDGTPLRGLIQDHVVGGVKLTKRDTFLEKWEYQQLLFASMSSLSGLEFLESTMDIELMPPAIMKPRPLWTGKQVISTILINLRRSSGGHATLSGLCTERRSKTPESAFGSDQEEHLVLVRDGELLRGVLDKSAFGATEFSLVHAAFEAYGPEKGGILLDALGRLFTAYIQYFSGHSCRIHDLILTREADKGRQKLVQRAFNIGSRAAKAWAESEGGKGEINSLQGQPNNELPLDQKEIASTSKMIGELLSGHEGKTNFASLDTFMQAQLNPLSSEIVKLCLPQGLAVPFPYNTFSVMTITGAKGSIVNQSQVTCSLGQQALEGRRVPRLSSGRTLPSFAPYDPNPRADGFVTDRFLTGIRPQEYYFHCMAGREGLVDTAVKTSRSGYLQRCLVKHLEELKICYDNTVRNAEGGVIQFLYGEDGLDPTKAAYLDCSHTSFEFMARNFTSLQGRYRALPRSTIDIAAEVALSSNPRSDPIMASFAGCQSVGSSGACVSERVACSAYQALKASDLTFKTSVTRSQMSSLIAAKYSNSLCPPGEAVGCIAAQSVGEPSTQMTLNTFHLAGAGANVTLGIPRLREILMTASRELKTPTMSVPLLDDVTQTEALRLARDFTRLALRDLLAGENGIRVVERLEDVSGSGDWQRGYYVTLNLEKACRTAFGMTALDVAAIVGKSFVRLLAQYMKQELRAFSGDTTVVGSESPSTDVIDANGDKDGDDSNDANVLDLDELNDEEQDEDVADDDDPKAEDGVEAAKYRRRAAIASYDDDLSSEDDVDTRNEELPDSTPLEAERFLVPSDRLATTVRANSIHLQCLHVDPSAPRLLMVGLVDKAAQNILVRSKRGISSAFVTEEGGRGRCLQTAGVNFEEIWSLDCVDQDRLMSNDVWAVATTYGVEAARSTIAKEIQSVFGAYGITVDPRHLSLVADYMTFEGGYKAMNRVGIESSCSPFLQMSFETTVHFLKNAAMSSQRDSLQSPSGNLSVGLPVRNGTGSFSVFSPKIGIT